MPVTLAAMSKTATIRNLDVAAMRRNNNMRLAPSYRQRRTYSVHSMSTASANAEQRILHSVSGMQYTDKATTSAHQHHV
jgi:hypothetical protein